MQKSFLVNVTLAGAWRGVEPGLLGVTMMTWGPCNDSAPRTPGVPTCKYRQGLEFFAAKGIHQFLGGYYVSCCGRSHGDSLPGTDIANSILTV